MEKTPRRPCGRPAPARVGATITNGKILDDIERARIDLLDLPDLVESRAPATKAAGPIEQKKDD